MTPLPSILPLQAVAEAEAEEKKASAAREEGYRKSVLGSVSDSLKIGALTRDELLELVSAGVSREEGGVLINQVALLPFISFQHPLLHLPPFLFLLPPAAGGSGA